MTTRQSLAPGLTKFAAACFSGGKNHKTGKSFCISSRNFKLAQGLHKKVVNINDPKGQEK